MWVRKRIDIKLSDIVAGLGYCMSSRDRQSIQKSIDENWSDRGDSIVCLSVRSGFDLLLQVLEFEADSQIVMSGLTIPDMPRIVSEHGLISVPVDLDMEKVAPRMDLMEQAITPQTRAILVAHLYGGLVDMDPIIELAKKHDLLVIEDCAQAYVGRDYSGDERADISMFSFGAIKTNTSLGGGVLRVRNPELLKKMEQLHEKWSPQSRLTFARRLVKYTFVKTLSTRIISSTVATAYRWLGKNHDEMAVRLVRGFAGPHFFDRIRHQPSTPLMSLMDRRLKAFSSDSIEKRIENGKWVSQALGDALMVLGEGTLRPSYWVLPLIVDDPQFLMHRLWRHGFDATCTSSLIVVPPIESLGGQPSTEATAVMKNIVYLPFSDDVPRSALKKMVEAILKENPQPRFDSSAQSNSPVDPQTVTSRSKSKIANRV